MLVYNCLILSITITRWVLGQRTRLVMIHNQLHLATRACSYSTALLCILKNTSSLSKYTSWLNFMENWRLLSTCPKILYGYINLALIAARETNLTFTFHLEKKKTHILNPLFNLFINHKHIEVPPRFTTLISKLYILGWWWFI